MRRAITLGTLTGNNSLARPIRSQREPGWMMRTCEDGSAEGGVWLAVSVCSETSGPACVRHTHQFFRYCDTDHFEAEYGARWAMGPALVTPLGAGECVPPCFCP
jgi:hypothetical protein